MKDEPVEIGLRGPEAGPGWSERAALDQLAAVIDPADVRGGKNRLIHRIHLVALSRSLVSVQGKRVLDFGCGTGRISAWLVHEGAAVEGVDVTSEMIDAARSHVPEASFRIVDGSHLPFADGSFDVVVAVYVLQYYVGRDETVFPELARVLGPRGRLVAIEQVTERHIGRGAPVATYEETFERAGLTVTGTSLIRASDSRLVATAGQHPALANAPGLPSLIAWQASKLRSLAATSYADALFASVKP
jgi:SAM-dependent methyltransferase